MKFLFKLAWLSLTAGATIRNRETASYDGYQVHRIKTVGNQASIKRAFDTIAHDIWEQSGGHWDILISPENVAAFNALELDSRTLHANLGKSILDEATQKKAWKRQTNASDDVWFDSYHPYDDTIEYITQQLVKGYQSGDNDTQAFLNNYDFYIYPIVNPDGFVFSQTNNRLWRKNRQPPPASAANQSCFGRDVNRNWETNWDADPRGASPDPCSEVYRGEAPRDTPENRGLDDTVRRLRDSQGIKLFVDFHRYSQLLLFPFGHRETLYPPELGKWTRTAALVSEVIRSQSKNATTFTFGPSGATLYPTTGSSLDHIYTVGRAEFSFTVELPDFGDFGFVLPPERIRPAVEEQWVGQQVMLSLLDEPFFDGEGPAVLTT